MNLLYLCMDWVIIILGNVFFIKHPGVLSFFLMLMINSARQHALLANLHEAIHGHLIANKFLNKFLGAFFCGWPIGVYDEGFKHYHLLHHRFLNTDLDPAWIPTKNKSDWNYPMPVKNFLLITLKDLCAINFMSMGFYEKLYSQYKNKNLLKKNFYLFGFYLFYFLLVFTLTRHLLTTSLCLFAWFISKYTFLVWLIRIRTAIEHYGQSRMTEFCRDVKAGFLGKFFVMPHHTGLHYLHHKEPAVPAWTYKEESSPLLIKGILNKEGAIRDILTWKEKQ